MTLNGEIAAMVEWNIYITRRPLHVYFTCRHALLFLSSLIPLKSLSTLGSLTDTILQCVPSSSSSTDPPTDGPTEPTTVSSWNLFHVTASQPTNLMCSISPEFKMSGTLYYRSWSCYPRSSTFAKKKVYNGSGPCLILLLFIWLKMNLYIYHSVTSLTVVTFH